MGWEPAPDAPPPDEAYSRVTNPERFAVVVDAADDLVRSLTETYDVTVTPLPPGRDPDAVRGVRLVPRAGAPVEVVVTDFPGVRVRRGHWDGDRQPECGCDACAEDPATCAELLREFVAAAVAGEFVEELTESDLTVHRAGGWRRSGLDGETFAALAAVAPPGRHTWPAWPRRG